MPLLSSARTWPPAASQARAAGGYQDECNWLLTLNTDDVLVGQASWQVPAQKGNAPSPRGYHAACIARIGGNTATPATVMLVAGGMCGGRSMLDLAMIDVDTWEWMPLPAFDPASERPCRRYGCTLAPFATASCSIMASRWAAPRLLAASAIICVNVISSSDRNASAPKRSYSGAVALEAT